MRLPLSGCEALADVSLCSFPASSQLTRPAAAFEIEVFFSLNICNYIPWWWRSLIPNTSVKCNKIIISINFQSCRQTEVSERLLKPGWADCSSVPRCLSLYERRAELSFPTCLASGPCGWGASKAPFDIERCDLWRVSNQDKLSSGPTNSTWGEVEFRWSGKIRRDLQPIL